MIARHRGPIPPGMTFRLPASLEPLRTELETFYHVLPGLLADGLAGKRVVIRGQTVHGTFDTFDDARAFGWGAFGDDKFIALEVNAEALEVFRAVFGTPVEAAS